MKSFLAITLAVIGGDSVYSCSNSPDTEPVFTYSVVNTFPHNRSSFTQGLVYDTGFLYEGTGIKGKSALQRVDLATGEILQTRPLEDRFFGEGITITGNKVIQLTWLSKVGFVYDRESFDLVAEFEYPTQGWGITHDGKKLIMSDGTAMLYFLDPFTFGGIGQIEVRGKDGPVTRLNELECVRGEIFANVWPTDRIARIAPRTGRVVGWIDLEGLLSEEDRNETVDVLNGIAYDAETDRLFVTGKLWPKLFEIQLVPPE